MSKNLMRFNKGKRGALGGNKCMHEYRSGADLLERYSAEKNLGVLMDNILTMNHQCAPVARKANGTLGCIIKKCGHRAEGSDPPPLYSALVRSHVEYWVHFWPLQFKKTGNYWM